MDRKHHQFLVRHQFRKILCVYVCVKSLPISGSCPVFPRLERAGKLANNTETAPYPLLA
jgi:hypothetical protein